MLAFRLNSSVSSFLSVTHKHKCQYFTRNGSNQATLFDQDCFTFCGWLFAAPFPFYCFLCRPLCSVILQTFGYLEHIFQSSKYYIPKIVIYSHYNSGRFNAEIDSGSAKVSFFDVLYLGKWSRIMAHLSLHSTCSLLKSQACGRLSVDVQLFPLVELWLVFIPVSA